MPRQKKHFRCEYDGCKKPATRALTYFVDPPRPYAPSLDAKQDAFCDDHAETETLQLQTPGFFTVKHNGIEVNCTVNLLRNCSIADEGADMKAISKPVPESEDAMHAVLKSESPDAYNFEWKNLGERIKDNPREWIQFVESLSKAEG